MEHPMSNILTFPSRSNVASRELDAGLVAFDASADGSANHYLALQRIIKISLAGQCSEMRQRAARWLLDVLNVDVAM